jgi:hypothetical protein
MESSVTDSFGANVALSMMIVALTTILLLGVGI